MIRVFVRPCGKTHNEEHAAAYELLYAAAELMGLKTGRVEKTKEGKPYFPEAENTFFSISHGGGYAAVAIGDSPCGLDIEGGREISEKIRNRFLDGASEADAILRWTERESRGKLFGGGFFDENHSEKVYYRYFSLPSLAVTVCAINENALPDKLEKL